jgi:hypothetical protein
MKARRRSEPRVLVGGPVGLDPYVQTVAERAADGEQPLLAEALQAWLQIACIAYAAAQFRTVDRALARARAIYGELTIEPTAERFGPWGGR